MTQEELHKLLRYDPENGLFYNNSFTARRGRVVGTVRRDGYVKIGIKGEQFLAHRLAWLYMYGEWPRFDIDHIDQNPSNNAIRNLRDVSRGMNNVNSSKRQNKTGFSGVYKNGNKYQAQISNRHLGMFDTPIEAHLAWLKETTKPKQKE